MTKDKPQAESAEKIKSYFSKLYVLVVDDVNAIRLQLRDMLKTLGVKDVYLCPGVEEALAALQEQPFNLVISDWSMEPLDGFALYDRMKSIPEFQDIPFILATGENRRAEVQKALSRGLDGYLLKPITARSLGLQIWAALKKNKNLFPELYVEQFHTTEIRDFLEELNGFYQVAEEVLSFIKEDPLKHNKLFKVFTERMFTIRSTAEQLHLKDLARIASLCEDISQRAAENTSRPGIRKALGALWDALSTMQFLLKEPHKVSDEHEMVKNRLESALEGLGGPLDAVTLVEIDEMLDDQ